ncbi:MAG: antibiotic biosynthesis monooxygenase [Candidatus Diapherotrites archaeon]
MYRVIFEHHPIPGKETDFIRQWQWGSDIIQTYPGARGTKLFRSLENPSILYAIADWESKPCRDRAMAEITKLPNGDVILKEHEKFLEKMIVLASIDLIAESNPPVRK